MSENTIRTKVAEIERVRTDWKSDFSIRIWRKIPSSEYFDPTPWKTFLKAHREGLAATDLFTVEVLTMAVLRRYFVLLVIELKTRHVTAAGIQHQP